MIRGVARLATILAVALIVPTQIGAQENKYGPGVSDNEIRIGNTIPYSGPASAWGTFGHAMSAYFNKVNAMGGINGRKINFISLDDAYSPPKAFEQVRKLVEQEDALLVFATGGTAVNTAVYRYLNSKKVPHLFVISGASKFADPENYPWTMGWQPTFAAEARVYTTHVLETRPNAKIGILYQNDDYGRDFVKGIRDTLGDKADDMIVASLSYEVTDPTIDTQIIKLKASGADVFYNVTSPKFTAQAIRKADEIGWKPLHFIYNGAASVAYVLKPAGLEASKGIVTGAFLRDPSDPEQQKTPEVKEYLAWAKNYFPKGRPYDLFNVFAYSMAQTLEYVLQQAGDDLTRANVLKQAASIDNVQMPMLLPGVKIDTSATDYRPIQSMQLRRFNGESWELFGDVIKN